MRRAAVLLLVAGVLAPAQAAVFPDETIAESRRAAAPRLQAATEALERRDTAVLDTLLDRWSVAAASDPLAHEFLLERTLHRLGLADELPGLRRRLEVLARFEPRARHWVEHDGRTRPRLLHRVDLAAQATLSRWNTVAESDALGADWRRGNHGVLRTASSNAATMAIQDAAPAMVRALPPEVLAGLSTASLLAVLDRRTDEVAWRELANREANGQVLHTLAAAPRRLSSAAAETVLRAATAQPGLASAAILASADLPRTRALESWWLDGLDDRAQGASHAHALSRAPSNWAMNRLAGRLDGADGPGLRHALLALKLDGGPVARDLLRRFSARQDLPTALRDQVSAWLR